MSPMNFGLFWEAIAETLLLFWIFNMLVKTLWTLVKTPFGQYWMPYIVFEKYLMWLLYKSNDLGWFACFRIQFLPDHIMIHSCLVCARFGVGMLVAVQGAAAGCCFRCCCQSRVCALALAAGAAAWFCC